MCLAADSTIARCMSSMSGDWRAMTSLAADRKITCSSRRPHTMCIRGWISDVCFSVTSRRRHTRCLSDWSSDVCSSDLIGFAACKANPMARALRMDKLTLAALEATLRLYRDPDTLARTVPVLRMLGETTDSVRARARRVLRALGAERAVKTGAEVIACTGEVGGGAMPLARVPSVALALRS